MLRADLHSHTVYSGDCQMSPEELVAACLKTGINCLAVTDHDSVEGALKTREIAPFPVIVGEEILTPRGEIMGLFLTRRVPSGLSAGEVVARIKEQGGLVCLPHPFDSMRLSIGREQALLEILADTDIVEVLNSRSLMPFSSLRARRFARRHSLLRSAGSDAHHPYEVGRAYVEMPEFEDGSSFLAALGQGRIFGRNSGPWVHLASAWSRSRSNLRR